MLAFLAGLAVGTAASTAIAWVVLRRRLEKLGRFFSFVAHELNTPITAVNMTVINLLSGVFGDIPKEQLRWVEMMGEQVGRLNGMVGELRDVIHIQLSRDVLLSVEETELAEIIQDSLARVRHGMLQAGIEASVRLDDSLPKVHVDRDRAVRALTSMIFHARKFRSSGGIVLEAHRGPGDRAVVHLRYQGQALSPDEARRSLELFYPAQKRKDLLLAATGLGLGALRLVARRQGGDLDFRVEPDGRSVISLVLPTSRMIQSKGYGH